MRKNLFGVLLLVFLTMLFVAGCGSSSNTSSNANSANSSSIGNMTAVSVQMNYVVPSVNGMTFSLSLPITKTVNSDYRVELSDFGLDIQGCYIANINYAPERIVLDGDQNTQQTLEIRGSFVQKCIIRGYTLYAKQAIVNKQDNNSKNGDVSFVKEYGTNENGYELINIPYQLDVSEYDRYKIDFQLIHNGNSVINGVVMEEEDENTTIARQVAVTVKAFPKQYGTVASHYGGTIVLPSEVSSQTTLPDADGVGRFLYSPPGVFPSAGTNYDLELVVFDLNTQEILLSQKIQLRFNLKSGASSGQATTLSIAYGYRPSKDGFTSPVPSGGGDNPGTGDYHERAEWDGENSKLINYYAVHAVNEDGNRPIIGIPITMTLINGVKKLGSSVIKVGSGAIQGGDTIQFSDASINFVNAKIESRDKLIVIPSEGKLDPSYLGGWNIDAVNEHSLNLNGMYSNIKNETRLSYLIGNERRLLGRNIVTADVQAIDLESITDEYGMAYFKVTYDPELVGHTITLEAHSKNETRVGISRIVKPVADSSIMQYIGKTRAVENSGSDEEMRMKFYLRIDTTAYRAEVPDSDTAALYPLIDLDIDPISFSMDANSSAHCSIDEEKSIFHISNDGTVGLVIKTDGNTTATGGIDKCSVIWEGSEEALGYDYEY